MPVAIDGADAVGLLRDVEPGVGLGLARGGDDQLREAVHAARLLAVDPVRRVEVLHLAGEVTGKSVASNCVIGPAPDSPAISVSHVVSHVVPERRDRARAR